MRIDAFIVLNSYFYRLRESGMIMRRISQYAFSIVVDKNPDLRFVKLCGDLLGLVWTWSISSSKSIWSVVFTRLHGLDYKALLWYICRMEVWFAVAADKISLWCCDEVRSWKKQTLMILSLYGMGVNINIQPEGVFLQKERDFSVCGERC